MTEEIIEFCMDYIEGGRAIGIPMSRHEGKLLGKGISGRKTFMDLGYKDVEKAHFSVLQQLQIAEKYIKQHINELQSQNTNVSED